MYCPSCGKTTSVEQKFCRFCGLSLEKVAQSLAEQLPAAELNKHLQERQRLVERLLVTLVGGGSAILVISIVWAIIDKVILGKGHVLGGLIFIAFILGLVTFVLLALYRDSLVDASGKHRLSQLTLPQSEPRAGLLPESYIEPIPSMTEHTTELLVAGKKRSVSES